MATDIDVCNLAASHIGESSIVTSLTSPTNTLSGHCARMYPRARDALQEMHTWGFTTRRVALALLSATPLNGWLYAYAPPKDMLNAVSVLQLDAADDYSAGLPLYGVNPFQVPQPATAYEPQKFALETLADGTDVVYTNQQDAVLRYTTPVTDATKFSPLFVMDLSYLLASMLAGPMVKGQEGAALSQKMLALMSVWHGKATGSDANQHLSNVQQMPAHLAGR